MRNKEVIEAFSHRREAVSSTGSLRSTGDCLYSYSTCIAEYSREGELYINLTKYSMTTSHHQSLLCRFVSTAHRIMYGIERNITHLVPKNERV